MSGSERPLPFGVENGRRVLYITYKGDCRRLPPELGGHFVETRTLQDALHCVYPGDILQLLPGKYWPPILFDEQTGNPPACKPVTLTDIAGRPRAPVTIRGLGARTLLDGGLGGVPRDSMLPDLRHFAFFKAVGCSWLEFENFHAASCWPCLLYIQDSSYITVRRVTCVDSRYMVYARGQDTHHILLEDNRWTQDPTGSIWRDLLWLDAKRKRYFYYNGGIFGSLGIPGSVVIRRNEIADAFNGMRMKADKKPAYAQNHNVEFTGNTLRRIRDNVVEPERQAHNWWVSHNRIRDAHAWFSLDEVEGGFWYFFANRGVAVDPPGTELDPNRGGKVYKYDKKGGMPRGPVFAFHNSWLLRASLIKSGNTTRLQHLSNAVLFTERSREDSLSDCGASPAPGPDDRFAGSDFLRKAWPKGVRLDGDLTNIPFPARFQALGQERLGREVPGAAYADPEAWDMRVDPPAPPGVPVVLRPRLDWPGRRAWRSPAGAPAGACDASGRLLDGPAFVFLKPEKAPEGYAERPRLVRLARQGARLDLYFSARLAGPGPVKLVAESSCGARAALEACVDGRVLRASLPEGFEGWELVSVLVPVGLKGADGEPVTTWATAFAGFGFHGEDEDDPGPARPVCFCDCGCEER
ncbi:hypothetical protein NNJEOMEG_03049 [Fundidesulfovibrio magnetotacticus]|uniref:Right handed beta helix domain-containing protein n=1 Tax=Fundidesulfovibrio magnetotacticus TaxID=2730080 RepID=A0A6V8LX79_9BACT|nr:right-handed parallel beta-helix repeat-containing protein [Fundidesulfovibrio magnetotacticus]GFK95191.1 hypothetical protein NNJEOMEG_03049 [Fundidesulfovibrio magnetotacticus]